MKKLKAETQKAEILKLLAAPFAFGLISVNALLAWLDNCTWTEAWDEADECWEEFWRL